MTQEQLDKIRHDEKVAHDERLAMIKRYTDDLLNEERYRYERAKDRCDEMQKDVVPTNPERKRLKRLYGRRGVIYAILKEKFGDGVHVSFNRDTREFTVTIPED